MLKNGLENEVKKLYEIDGIENSTASQAIGYKELKLYLNNKISRDEAIEKIKQESRRYAKRQMTWFNHMDIKWFFVDKLDYNDILNNSVKLISDTELI